MPLCNARDKTILSSPKVEAVIGCVLWKKLLSKISQNSQENVCAGVSFFNKVAGSAWNFIKKEAPAQVFSFEFCEIFKSTFFHRRPPVTASGVGPVAHGRGKLRHKIV